ncbi:TetR/AcrR family transcriptional regulator [Paenibacillus psychroresistens]|uniref:TetR/AcrR family transcriptional regulator n=1 Tax=Paenibacillus psychroresistens TaxID=1778678 RepID=A0A6B8RSJ2_9BACL|nr:TetR/AcrR family transcriptional regulator [Paenibacillus psychroresistens]QGQ98899.1 TetR/AcrR family transcriptional regulator [Paenibacillus psychroresistens]
MGRPREFDQEMVLDKATELFWSKGYERTSIQDLTEHTGVHRGSIYDTFGDKNALFLSCLDRFRLNSKKHLFYILDEPGIPKVILERFFEKVIDGAMSDSWQRKGCLMANTATELAPIDSNVASRVEAYSLDMENMFYSFLLRAQKDGNLKSKHNLRELSRFLVNTRQGLYVMSKTAGDSKILKDAVKVALSVLS